LPPHLNHIAALPQKLKLQICCKLQHVAKKTPRHGPFLVYIPTKIF